MVKYYLYKLAQFCVTRLSLSQAYRLATVLSDLQYFLSPRDRRAVRNNLRQIVTGASSGLDRMSRDVFRNFGMYLVEFFRMSSEIDQDFIRERVEVKNLSYLKQALEKGRGVIMVTGHIGNWELGGVVTSLLGYPSLAIALPHKERPVNSLFNQQREKQGVHVVPMASAVRRCLSALKGNGIVALLADRDFNATGEKLDFLGKKAIIPKGAALFAAKTGAVIVPVFFLREKQGHFQLVFEAPIIPQAVTEGEVDRKVLVPLMEEYTRVIEAKIRQYPTQWLMFRPFWERQNTPDIIERQT